MMTGLLLLRPIVKMPDVKLFLHFCHHSIPYYPVLLTCDLVTFLMMSGVSCGTGLYGFLIIAIFLSM